ncbi:MAG: peptidylprolyl isomerase [Bradyrhizobium sp.]|nr:MAG: peptidylprolyl isomerase [Bradyrhizobium sp.]
MTFKTLAPAKRLALLLALSLSAAWLAPAHADPRILAKVNGLPITEEDVADAMQDIGPGLPQKLDGPARAKYVLDYLIDLRLVAEKAKADKLDQGADFTRRLDYYHNKLAMESLLSQVGKSAATDDAARKAYDDAAKAQPPVEEIHARHILLPTEEEAKAALARVKAGEDFAKVATELSKDPAGDGGDLGWFTKDRMVPEFADAAFKLQPGQISDPVKSQFGWHIIKVEERRMRTFPPFEELKDQASRYVAQKAQSDLITSLHTTAKIERFDEAGNAVPDAPPSPPADAPAAPAPDDAKPKAP